MQGLDNTKLIELCRENTWTQFFSTPLLPVKSPQRHVAITRSEIFLKTDGVAFNSKKQTRGPYYLVNSFTLRNSFFFLLSFFWWGGCRGGGVNLTKKTDKHSYSGYGISFNVRRIFSLANGGFGKNIMIFLADMRPSVYANNKKKISQFLVEV